MPGEVEEAGAAPRRSSVAAPASHVRQSKARASVKAWMQDEERRSQAAQNDAVHGGVNAEEAKQLVSNVTRFATVMCVIIAVVKVIVYNVTGAAVVKTSALDSAGDLIANMITMYTGYRMMNEDLTKFPVGQSRFEPLGVLVFSTLMATMMFGNILENFGDLISSEETSREDGIAAFWKGLFGQHVGQDGNIHKWDDPDTGFNAFAAAMVSINQSLVDEIPDYTTMAKVIKFARDSAPTFENSYNVIEKTQNEAAEVPDPELAWGTLLFQNAFLGCCATYKLCLFLYVQFVAIPKTGSTVLQALANDKRNDFIATSFVITITFFAKICEEGLDNIKQGLSEMIDPLASLTLSIVIMYTWGSLVVEQLTALSCSVLEPEVVEGIRQEVATALRGASCDFQVRAYYSSTRSTVEVDLLITNASTTFQEVSSLMATVTKQVQNLEDIERVVVVPKWGV